MYLLQHTITPIRVVQFAFISMTYIARLANLTLVAGCLSSVYSPTSYDVLVWAQLGWFQATICIPTCTLLPDSGRQV